MFEPGADGTKALQYRLEKALRKLILSAFFVFASSQSMAVECERLGPAVGLPVEIVKVYDGDTVKLSSGEKLRFGGINAPEVPHRDQFAQPYAEEARRRVEMLLQEHSPWLLITGKRRSDRYQRLLGHLVSTDGIILEQVLLAEGLAFLVVKPPDTAHALCFEAAQSIAQAQSLGVWSSVYWRPRRARSLTSADAGYRHVEGVITKVEWAKDIFIELDEALAIRVRRKNMDYFPGLDRPAGWSKLLGQKVLVKGWLIARQLSAKQKAAARKGLFMEVGTHFDFRVLPQKL